MHLPRRDVLHLLSGGLACLALGGQEVREAARKDADPDWERASIRRLWEERARMGVTPLQRLDPPFGGRARLYLKLECASPTGSLKHRVAWGLLMNALVNGFITKRSRLFECSSGNTAIAEAHFARILGLPFTAILRPGVSEGKLRAIRGQGGEVIVAPAGTTPSAHLAQLLPSVPNGYDLNQFANAEKALDTFDAEPSRSMNLAAEVFRQLAQEGHPCPDWFVAGSGTGGTATSIARYLRKWADQGGRACPARLAVVDPEGSVLFDWFRSGDGELKSATPTRIEGIGNGGPVRFGQNYSLLRGGISRMFKVPDNASVAGMAFLSEHLGQSVGASTGTNLIGALRLLRELERGGGGTVVALVNDTGTRYQDTYFNDAWLETKGLKPGPWRAALDSYWRTGAWEEPG
jgi:cysteine synthase